MAPLEIIADAIHASAAGAVDLEQQQEAKLFQRVEAKRQKKAILEEELAAKASEQETLRKAAASSAYSLRATLASESAVPPLAASQSTSPPTPPITGTKGATSKDQTPLPFGSGASPPETTSKDHSTPFYTSGP